MFLLFELYVPLFDCLCKPNVLTEVTLSLFIFNNYETRIFKYEFDEDEDDADIGNKEIWGALQPYIPKIKQIVKDNRNKEGFAKYYPDDPDREPHLDWIFFRKYSPEDERNSLKHHHDTNMNTVNIELSNDYEGGGLFYIKPLASTREIDKKYDDMNYEWVDTIKRENTTELSFPELHAGDAIFYNYTVEHGVAPVESGKRYSMAFFFDNNPEVEDDLDSNDSDDDNGSEDNEDEEEFAFDVKLKNELPDQEVDIVLVLKMTNEEIWKKVFDNVKVNETTIYNAYEGDSLKVLKSGTDTVVTELDIKREQALYTIFLNDSAHTEL